MIPVYIVLLIGIAAFLITGHFVLARHVGGDKYLPLKKKCVSLISFALSIILTIMSISFLREEVPPQPGDTGKKLISSTLAAEDVHYISGRSVTKTLKDGVKELKEGGTIEYKDSLYNKVRVSSKDVLSYGKDESLSEGQVKIEKRLVKLKGSLFFKYGICYVIVLPD